MCAYGKIEQVMKMEGGGENLSCSVSNEEKALLYVAIVETMSVIILRIERQYKQFPYITT